MKYSEIVFSLHGIEEKKNFLKQFSEKFKETAKSKGLTVNDLLTLLYKKEGYNELHTYKSWVEKGRKVKKGAKSLILWSCLIKKSSSEDEKSKGFFSIAHVFDVSQTEEIN